MILLTSIFKEAVTKASKLSGSPESNSMRLEAMNNILYLTAISSSSRLLYTLPCEGDLAPIYIDKEVLSKMLSSRVLDAPISMILNEGKLEVKQGEFFASITTIAGTYNFNTETDYTFIWNVNSEWLCNVLHACAIPVSRDEKDSRGILIEIKNNKISIVGADSVGPGQTHIVENTTDIVENICFALNRQSAQLISELEDISEIRFEKGGRRILVCGKNYFLRISGTKNSYPSNYRDFFQLDTFYKWNVLDCSKADMLFALSSAQSVMSDADQAYKFSLLERQEDDDKLVLKISGRNDKSKSKAFDKILVDGNISEAMDFALRRGKLESSLKTIKSDRFKMYIKNPESPVVITDSPDSGFRSIHLPLRAWK